MLLFFVCVETCNQDTALAALVAKRKQQQQTMMTGGKIGGYTARPNELSVFTLKYLIYTVHV